MPDVSISRRITGILLAAGRGSRFDHSGAQDKLLQALPGGDAVVIAAAKHLLAVLPTVVAVVRSDNPALGEQLKSTGCLVTFCENADEGMAASLVHALSCASEASGWVIALGDMPYVQSTTIHALCSALERGADIAVPTFGGQRGNPVAFSRAHLHELQQLRGDEGARRLLKTYPVTEVATEDPGVRQDIDTPEDLAASRDSGV
jgi:molybdenum cofactor cytidylyltransferase